MRTLRRLRELSGPDRWLLVQAWYEVALITSALRCLPFRRWKRWLVEDADADGDGNPTTPNPMTPNPMTPNPMTPNPMTPERETLRGIAWAVTAAARRVPGARCLPIALAAHRLLARRGFPSQVQVGVARGEDGEFRAHAWVECRGIVVVGEFSQAVEEQYKHLMTLVSEDANE